MLRRQEPFIALALVVLFCLIAIASHAATSADAALAQQKPPTDQQIEQARAAMLGAEASFFQMASQKLQAQLAETASHAAATERWWANWWKGAYPDTAAPAPAAAAPAATPK